jgi:homoserine O-acetyltransferase
VLGIDSDIDGDAAHVISSPFGHDGFLIESALVGAQLSRLLGE